jgi:hypothetical protein
VKKKIIYRQSASIQEIISIECVHSNFAILVQIYTLPWIEIFQFFLHIFIIWVKLSIFGEKKFEKSFIFAEKIEFENSDFLKMGTH